MHNNTKKWNEIEKNFGQEQGLPFMEALPEKEIRDVLAEERVTYRQRVFTPIIVIWAFLSQIFDRDSSDRKSAARVLAFLVAQQQQIFSATAGGYCRAKHRLKTSIWARLVRGIGKKSSDMARPEDLWLGRKVKTFDGSSLVLQDTPENQSKYPKWQNQHGTCSFPIARWAVLFCLSTGAVLEMYLEPMNVSERVLFRRFYNSLSRDDVVLGDRGTCSFYDMALLIPRGVDAVLRLHATRKVDFSQGIRLGRRDHIVAWDKPTFDASKNALSRQDYDSLVHRIWIRELEIIVEKPGFRTKKVLLATTLTDPDVYTKEDLAQLYFRRWEAEVNLRHLKTTLKMEMLKSKSPEMACKEVWAHLLLYNLIRRVMWNAGTRHNVQPLRISFKGTIDRICVFLPQLTAASIRKKKTLYELLLWTISQDILPRREGRIYQRCIKRRPKAYPWMTKSRSEYRASVLN